VHFGLISWVFRKNVSINFYQENCQKNTTKFLKGILPTQGSWSSYTEGGFQKPNVSHFRIFGTKVYCHLSKDSKKLEPTTEKGIFMGYSETTQAYRMYLPGLEKKVLRPNVRF